MKVQINIWSIIAFLIALFLGYLLGNSFREVETKIEYETKWLPSKEVRDTIYYPKPVPAPYEVIDTIFVPVPQPTDTAALFAVWRDYYLKRDYSLDFSNDTLGTFKVDASVRENKLIYATSTIKPNIRTLKEKEIVYKVPIIQFYTLFGTSVDLTTNQIQFGIDLKQKYLIGVSGIRMDNKFGYAINAGIKF